MATTNKSHRRIWNIVILNVAEQRANEYIKGIIDQYRKQIKDSIRRSDQ